MEALAAVSSTAAAVVADEWKLYEERGAESGVCFVIFFGGWFGFGFLVLVCFVFLFWVVFLGCYFCCCCCLLVLGVFFSFFPGVVWDS